jgi:hypothetical protein
MLTTRHTRIPTIADSHAQMNTLKDWSLTDSSKINMYYGFKLKTLWIDWILREFDCNGDWTWRILELVKMGGLVKFYLQLGF